MKSRLGAVAVAGVLVFGLTACTSAGPFEPTEQAAEPTEQAAEPSEQAVKLPQDMPEDLDTLGLNDRGNIPVNPEATAEFKDPESGVVFAEISARTVQTDFTCTAPDALESINGQFVAITFDVDMADGFAESGFPTMEFSVHDFRAWDANGDSVLDPVGNAEACVSPQDRIASSLEPGGHERGLVVLDAPKGSGSASYLLGGFQGTYGWEWAW